MSEVSENAMARIQAGNEGLVDACLHGVGVSVFS